MKFIVVGGHKSTSSWHLRLPVEEKRQVLGRVVTIGTLYLTVNIYYCCDYLPLLHCVNLVLLFWRLWNNQRNNDASQHVQVVWNILSWVFSQTLGLISRQGRLRPFKWHCCFSISSIWVPFIWLLISWCSIWPCVY